MVYRDELAMTIAASMSPCICMYGKCLICKIRYSYDNPAAIHACIQ